MDVFFNNIFVMFSTQAKYKERGTVLAEDQIVQVSLLLLLFNKRETFLLLCFIVKANLRSL